MVCTDAILCLATKNCDSTYHAAEKERKEKTTPFGVNLMRSQVSYRAALQHQQATVTGNIIDSDYWFLVKVLLLNNFHKDLDMREGDRIAQHQQATAMACANIKASV